MQYLQQKKESNSLHYIDETIIQIGNQHFWLWFCIEPIYSSVLGIYSSEERNMIIVEKFIRSLVDKYGKHTVYTDGGTWYDEACNVLGLKHYLHIPFQNMMERVNNQQYFKDRTESFDEYFTCNNNKQNCDLGYIYNWLKLFVNFYNSEIRNESLFIRGGKFNLLTPPIFEYYHFLYTRFL